jgi:hypothetical protein
MMWDHINFVFQFLTFGTILLLMVQVKIADSVDRARGHRDDWLFRIRRFAMLGKGLALCIMVIYSHERGWEPWPPVIGLLAALDAYIASEIMIMRRDLSGRNGRSVA